MRERLFALVDTAKETERYKIIARNKSFVLQSNRPLLQSKGLKHFPITWKVVQGGYDRPYILEQIIKAIEKKLNEL